ncbi:hypothetical protein ACFVVM_03775 [Nocardia sp. NPDC058176]|uniref:hypothetical protein n=1 Tax=Nocardia sp. NPDC058176 TaxID=3346368 RepID=UPI0036DEC5C0
MDHNDEEMMREDFARVVRLEEQIADRSGPEVSEDVEFSLDVLGGEHARIRKSWASGPHAEHWGHLEGAYAAWDWLDLTELNADLRHGQARGLTEIQQRNVLQAGELHARRDPQLRKQIAQAIRDRAPRRIERSR